MAKKKNDAPESATEGKAPGLDLRGFRKALDAISSKIPGIIADSSANQLKRGVFLDSPQLTFLFGGKYPTDRIMQLQGPESSGKSTISNYIAGQLQKKRPNQPVVVYVDYERTFDPVYAGRLGLDTSPDKFILLHPECGEDGFEAMDALVRTGSVCCMILDSDAAMPTRSMTTDEYGKACVGPDTLISFKPHAGFLYRTGTMLELFEKAGFGDFESMEEGVYHSSDKAFYVKTFDLGSDRKTKKKVLGFVYKGMAKKGYRVTSDYGSFLATGDHLIFDASKYTYLKLKDCQEEVSVIAADGTITTAVVSKADEQFPILDIEVEDAQAYFSGGILSHNTFGGTAKLASDALKRINILLNKYDTNLIWISQERASMEMYGSPFKACVTPDTLVDIEG